MFSPYRIWTNIPSLALPALASAPHFVEFLDGGGHSFICSYSKLNVTPKSCSHSSHSL